MYIKKRRILFVPNTMPSHCIPLVALAKMLGKTFECAFLLPKGLQDAVRVLGIPVLEIDRDPNKKLTPEIAACGSFRPDLIVDDLSATTAYITRIMGLPRVSVVRKGILPFESRTSGYRHSSALEGHVKSLEELDLTQMVGSWKPKDMADLFVGDLNIIPSIPSVEVLPWQLRDKGSYIYSGPLLLNDDEMFNCVKQIKFNPADPITVNNFFERNSHRKIVYFTIGIAMPKEIRKHSANCIRSLLNKGAAVITNICDYPIRSEDEANRILASVFLPGEKVCSHADLMIHQCGSGTYNYQLSHELPAIILGSNCYDRDDVAKRLHELGAAHYIADDGVDEATHQRRFDTALAELLDNTSAAFHKQKASLARLKSEIVDTQKNFDGEKFIHQILARGRQINKY